MKKLLVITVVIISTCFAKAQWTQCPLYGGNIRTVAVSDSFVYAGTLGGGGVFRSENYANNWAPANTGLPFGLGYDIFCLAARGNEVFVSVNLAGMFKSSDNGLTWDSIYAGLPSNYEAWDILFTDSIIYMATPNGAFGVYKSADNGNTWTSANGNLTHTYIHSIVCDSTGVFVGTNWYGVYKSTDNGDTWVEVNNGLPQTDSYDLCDMVIKDNVLYVGIELGTLVNSHRIYKSTDGGANWTLSSYAADRITTLAVCGDKVFMGTTDGAYKSSDGTNWASLYTGMTNKYVTSFAVNGWDIFAGTKGGIFRLESDISVTWVPVSNGISTYSFKAMDNIGNTVFAGDQSYGAITTTDHGDSWQEKNGGLADPDITSLCASGEYIYAGNSTNFLKSFITWTNWSVITTGLPTQTEVHSIAAHDNGVYIATSSGVFRSADYGTTWSLASTGLPSLLTSSVTVNNDGVVYCTVNDIGIYMSVDNGTSWSCISSGFGGLTYVNCIDENNDNLFAGVGYFNPPVVTTNNNGANWSIGNNGLYGHQVQCLKSIGNYEFAGVNNGIFFTKNNGTDWVNITDNLPPYSVISIGRDDSLIFAGIAGKGIWKRPLADFGIDFSSADQNKFSESIYIFPNPATNLVYINCEEKSVVEILNLQGQVVATKTISGKNESVDVSGLAQGVYVVKVKTEQGVITKKIVKQ